MKAVLVFCEGRHDVVFVQRSLKALGGCRKVTKKIAQLPSPFGAGRTTPNGLLAKRLARSDVEDLTLKEAVRSPRPWFETPYENRSQRTIFFPVWTGGKGASDSVSDLLRDLEDAYCEPSVVGNYDASEYAAAFLFDADADGVEGTLRLFRRRYAERFGDLSSASHGHWLDETTVPVGCFLFHRSDDDPTGTLEDHLEPMAEQAWPDRYAEARRFIEEHRQPDDEVSRNDAQRVKSTITVSGQFDHPGAPMTQIIRGKGFPLTQFQQSALSRAIAEFLTCTRWKGSGAG